MRIHQSKNARRDDWVLVRRVVIKIGTSIVTAGTNEFSAAQVEPLLRSIARLKREGRQVVFVSSGAVGLGAGKLKLDRARLNDLATRQACAAVGQSLLMHAYEELFSKQGVPIAQVLLTEDDFMDRTRHLNLRRTIEKLLKLGVLPIINENDTVSTVELELKADGVNRSFGDNDRLAALVMSKLDADALIILTSVDGLLRTPVSSKSVEVVPLVTEIDSELRALARGRSATGRGGMETKLEAAEIAMRTGGLALIANGTKPDTLDRIFAGEQVGTFFVSGARLKGKRRWIAYAAGVRGRLVVNAGARDAIVGGKASLLASGVLRVEDQFEALDVVSIIDVDGREFARGMANCTSLEAERLIGSGSATAKTGRARVLVTRNNIVLMEK
ncbi:MAG TPA: glutamate 5-kinase [Pyrinomonadaceae bacterium]|nr:glutamate 5-kinase [Pyrinomonadaceae bacterium]